MSGKSIFLLSCAYLFLLAVQGNEDDSAAVDPLNLAQQWEEYSKTVLKNLDEEKNAGLLLKKKISNLQLKISEHGDILLENEKTISQLKSEIGGLSKTLQSKETTIDKLKKDLKLSQSNLEIKEDEAAQFKEELTLSKETVTLLRSNLHVAQKRNTEIEALETKVKDLTKKLKSKDKAIKETKAKLEDTQSALNYAKSELRTATEEAAKASKELHEVHAHLLPTWLSSSIELYSKEAKQNWNIYGKPAVASIQRKILEGVSTSKAYLLQAKDRVKPILTPYWEKSVEILGPHVTKINRILSNQAAKLHKDLNPHFQRIAEQARPHFEVAVAAFEKRKQQVLIALEKTKAFEFVEKSLEPIKRAFLEVHSQVRESLKEALFSFEQFKDVPEDVFWYLALGVLLIPLLFLLPIGFSLISGEDTTAEHPAEVKESTKRKKKSKRAE